MSAVVLCYLGLDKKLRNGGRYGIPSEFIKNIRISDIDDFRSYIDLYMGKEDKKTWEYIYNLTGKVDSTQTGVTGEGIDYVAVTLSDPGKYLPITIFLYETPENKLNIYCPTRGNICIDKRPIPDCSKITKSIIDNSKNGHNTKEEDLLASNFILFGGRIIISIFPKAICTSLLGIPSRDVCDVLKIGPDKITVDFDSVTHEVTSSMTLMIEDFSHRVVTKSASTAKKAPKPKPIIGGPDKELLWIHPDAKGWLSHKFAWKTKGIFTGMTSDNPDCSIEEAKKLDFEDCIFQFDKGVLYEDSRTGDRDSATWRCESWDDVWFDDSVRAKIKKLYPGIQPENIFLSDED